MRHSIWDLLLSSDSLIEEAEADSIRMLDAGREMFKLVLHLMHEKPDSGAHARISTMDKSLNDLQRDVRKKVYEHLALSGGKNLLTGLQLTSIVIDLERIGDYTKNMAELLDMFPDAMSWDPWEETVDSVTKRTLEQFDTTRVALGQHDEKRAREVLDRYDDLSKACDGVLSEIAKSRMGEEMIEKRFLALVLIMRYLKRVNAHLKNVVTSIINPFHEIGFRPGAL